MGYEFTLEQARVEASMVQVDQVNIKISVDLKNSGVAPFYYPLSLRLTSLETGEFWVSNVEMSSLLPIEESQEIIFDINTAPAVTLSQGFTLTLTSPHLLEGQVIRWANQEQSEGVLPIASDFNCTLGSSTITLGASAELTQGRCFCDVDGLLYTVDGVSCAR